MGITMREFAQKYNVPYQLVYNAHWDCPCYNKTMRRHNMEFDEHELFEAVLGIVKANIRRYHDKADEQVKYLDNLRGFG